MGLFSVAGVAGQIRTTWLPSGDLAVAGPTAGALEQLMFEVCRWSGRRNADYGGWIIPSAAAERVMRGLRSRCTKTAD